MAGPTVQSWEATEEQSRRKSMIYTSVVMALLLVFMIIFGLWTPFPPPEAEGLLVDFGTTSIGSGPTEPTTSAQPSTAQPVEASATQQETITQETFETVALPDEEQTEDPVKEVEQPKEEVKPKEEPVKEEPKEPEINKDFLFGENEHDFNSNSSSEGNTEPGGNMGDPSGGEADNYLGQSTGVGDGISFGLGGRRMLGKPQPDKTHQEEGTIRITIEVDRNGNVVNARYSRKGSTITTPALIQKYVRYAKTASFSKGDKELQVGWIEFKLKLE